MLIFININFSKPALINDSKKKVKVLIVIYYILISQLIQFC